MTDVYASFDALYFIGYSRLHLYNDANAWQDYFTNQYQPVYDVFADRFAKANLFWMNIDAYLANNTDTTDAYVQQELALKNDDLCSLITIIEMTPVMLEECQLALNQASALGFLHVLDAVVDIFQTQNDIMMSSNYSRNATEEIIAVMDFKGLDDLLFYTDCVWQQYIENMRTNLKVSLQLQFNEAYIFLCVGVVIVLSGFVFGILPLIKHMKNEFKQIKKIYGLFPLNTLMMNSYIKKWLLDNSVSAYL